MFPLQYVNKINGLAADSMPTTGSVIPKHEQTTVSTMLSFDQSGRFIRAWSNSKSKSGTRFPSELGSMGQVDVDMNIGAAH